MDYNGHVDAGEHYFGRRFFWSEIACGLAKWLYIGKHSYFFPEFESLSPSKLNKSFVSFFATIQNMDEEVSIPPPPSWKLRITETRPKCPVCLLCNLTTPITSELFRDDLGKEIDEVSSANKLSRKRSSKRSSRKGYDPYNTQHRHAKVIFILWRWQVLLCGASFRGKGLLKQESRSKAINIPLQQGDQPLHCNPQVGYMSSIDSNIRFDAPFKAGQLRH